MPAILRLRQFAHDELGMVFAYALIMPTIHLHAYLHVKIYITIFIPTLEIRLARHHIYNMGNSARIAGFQNTGILKG